MSKSVSILYVDDSILDRELVRDALTREATGFELTEAATKDEFFSKIESKKFDLVLTDFNILGFLGLAVLETVHSISPATPVVIVTGTGSEEVAVEALRLGAADYVIKTERHIRRLPDTIRMVLDKVRLAAEKELAEAQVRLSEKRLQEAEIRAKLGSWEFDISTQTAWWSRQMAAFFGYDPDAPAPDFETFLELIHPDDREFIRDRHKRANTVSAPETHEYRGHPSRGVLYLQDIVECVQNNQGQLKLVGTTQDITERKLAQNELEKVFEISDDLIGISGMDGILQRFNPAFQKTLGFTQEELCSCPLSEFIHPEDRVGWIMESESAHKGLRANLITRRFLTKNGDIRWLEWNTISVPEEGKIYSVARDITERIKLEQALSESENRFQATFNRATVGMARLSKDAIFLEVNPCLCDLLGYNAVELVGSSLWDIIHEQDITKQKTAQKTLLSGRVTSLSFEQKYIKKNGLIVEAQVTIAGVPGPDGKLDHLIQVTKDISQTKQYEIALDFVTRFDTLTGLENAVTLRSRIQDIASSDIDGKRYALVALNIDRFGNINRTLGALHGDMALREVAHRLRTMVKSGPDACVARLGADHFGILLPISNDFPAEAIPSQIQALFAPPFLFDGLPVQVSMTGGIALFPGDAIDSTDFLRNAESALSFARKEGPGTILFYSTNMNRRAREILEIESAMRSAVKNNEFYLLYQPQLEFLNGKICGLEALIRWKRPGIGIVSPADFIPLAEETRQILEIGRWVIQEALRQMVSWQKAGVTLVPVAINVSARQFAGSDFVPTVLEMVKSSGLSPGLIELEITESVLVGDEKALIEMLKPLRVSGITIAIDDFGTGYSSLAYLRKYPIGKLKIDRSFVMDIVTNREALEVARAIIALADTLSMQSLAEGVETSEQVKILKANGCWGMQGFYFRKPLPADEAFQLIKENEGKRFI